MEDVPNLRAELRKVRAAAERQLEVEKARIGQTLAARFPLAAFQDWSHASGWMNEERVELCGQVRVGQLEARGAPVMLDFSGTAGIWIEAYGSEEDRQGACHVAENMALRMVFGCRPGLVRVYTCDLLTLGRAFSRLAQLGPGSVSEALTEVEEFAGLVNRLWDQVSGAYMRFGSHGHIASFNEANSNAPEPYTLVCINGIGEKLGQGVVEKLQKLMSKGNASQAGVFLIAVGSKGANPKDSIDARMAYLQEAFFANLVAIGHPAAGQLLPSDPLLRGTAVRLESERLDLSAALKAYAAVRTTPATPVGFEDKDLWSRNSARGLRIPLGRDAAGRIVELTLGEDGLVHNVLVGGAVGSGKTILLHNIILQVSTLYSPEEVQLLLLDYKDGTEFIAYENLPHARVLSVGSEVEFGLRTFEWLGRELERRSDLFKQYKSNEFHVYRGRTGARLPRLLVVIDEFQRLLADPLVGLRVAGLLDDIVRRGRSRGVHVVLSTQSLAGVNIEPSTLSNLVGRICLRLGRDEVDRFLSFDNLVPTGFSKPGQAVFNNAEGRSSGNVAFQVDFLASSVIEGAVARLVQQADARAMEVPDRTVFHGSELEPVISLEAANLPAQSAAIGVELAIGARQVAITFARSPNAHLLAVGADEGLLSALLGNVVFQLARNTANASFLIHDCSARTTGADWSVVAAGRHRMLDSAADLSAALEKLAAILTDRKSKGEAVDHPPIYLVLLEPTKSRVFSALGEDDPVRANFSALVKSGSLLSLHVLVADRSLAGLRKRIGDYGTLSPGDYAHRIGLAGEDGHELFDLGPRISLGYGSGYLATDRDVGGRVGFRLFAPMAAVGSTSS